MYRPRPRRRERVVLNPAQLAGVDDLQAQFEAYRETVHNLATSIQLAEQTGQTEAAAGLKAQLTNLLALMRGQVATLKAAEMPSSFMMTLQQISDDLTTGLHQSITLLPRVATGVGLALGAAAVVALVLYLPKRSTAA